MYRSLLLLTTGTALSVVVGGCSPRYSIHEVSGRDFEVEGDAYVFEDGTLTVAYDFWSADGVPYISFFNASPDTLTLDLHASSVSAGWGRETLARLMGSGSGAYRDLVFNYPDLLYTAAGNAVKLPPAEWQSIYGMAQHPGQGSSKRSRSDPSVYVFELSSGGAQQTYTHTFADRLAERMNRREFTRYAEATAAGNVYYRDRGPQRGLVAMEILTLMLNVAIIF